MSGCGRIRTDTRHVLDVVPLPKVGVRSPLRSGRESNSPRAVDSRPASPDAYRTLSYPPRDSNAHPATSEAAVHPLELRGRVVRSAGFEPAGAALEVRLPIHLGASARH